MSDHDHDPAGIGALLDALMGGDDFGQLNAALRMMEWAQDEIEKAQFRHGEIGGGPLFRTFHALALPAEGGFEMEPVYRAHARELLERVAAHEDLKPATNAEIIIALKSTSLIAPLNSNAVTLYFRMFARTLPDMWKSASGQLIGQQQLMDPEGAQLSLDAYESVHGSQADDIEAWARTHVAVVDRSGHDPHTVPAPDKPEQPTDDD